MYDVKKVLQYLRLWPWSEEAVKIHRDFDIGPQRTVNDRRMTQPHERARNQASSETSRHEANCGDEIGGFVSHHENSKE